MLFVQILNTMYQVSLRYTRNVRKLKNASVDMMIAPGEGYIPTYTRTDITDALHDAFGFRTDYQITSQKNMRKILNQTKKK